jgi:hypothetical protein
MFDPNNLHPLPRYGLAAALFSVSDRRREVLPTFNSEADYATLARQMLFKVRSGFLLQAHPQPLDAGSTEVRSTDVDLGKLLPGKANNRNSANGFFLAPHILTGNNSASLVKEMAAISKLLEQGKLDKLYGMKRSFSPLTSKINAGTRSMSDPPDDILSAAFTAIGVATKYKAAALDYNSFTNVGLIPDLDFYDQASDTYPLLDYIQVLEMLQRDLGPDRYKGTLDSAGKKYGRPSIYRGNYNFAPDNVSLGSVSLLAAMSGWMSDKETFVDAAIITRNAVDKVLDQLASRPIYTFGYEVYRQEQFGHHLIELTRNGELAELTRNIWKIRFYDSPNRTDYSLPKWKLLQRYLDGFLRFFTQAAFRNFLSLRANYPPSFQSIFKKYFIMSKGIDASIVDAAMSLGQSLNRAAYASAKEKVDADNNKTGRDIYEYKARVIASLESNIRSANTAEKLLAQVSTLVGRITKYDLAKDSAAFMRAVLVKGEDHLELGQAKDLLIAFMRLNQNPTRKTPDGDTSVEDDDGMG